MNNIKKLIFDVDNTLIYWKSEYVNALKKTIDEYNLGVETKIIDNIIENLENKYDILSKNKLLSDINSECCLNISMDFIDSLFEKQKKLADLNEKVIDIISYLSKKYELIIYTNYFHEVQEGRLETAGILKYFSRIYGGDDIPVKPNVEGFEKIIGDDDKFKYIMIGDSIDYDILGANRAGIKSILYDYKNIYNDSEKYIRITDLGELKEML